MYLNCIYWPTQFLVLIFFYFKNSIMNYNFLKSSFLRRSMWVIYSFYLFFFQSGNSLCFSAFLWGYSELITQAAQLPGIIIQKGPSVSDRPSLSSAPPSQHVHPRTHRQCRAAGPSWLELNKLPRAWPWLRTRESCSQAPVGEASLNCHPQSQIGSSAQFTWAGSFLMWVA